MKQKIPYQAFIPLVLFLFFMGCKERRQTENISASVKMKSEPVNQKWSEQMAQSIMTRHPES